MTLCAGRAVHQLLAADVAADKPGARGISAEQAEQLPRNRQLMVGNPRESGRPDKRLLLIGHTDGRLAPLARRPGASGADGGHELKAVE
jgi:hypothetical protein